MKKFIALYMATPEQIDKWMSASKEEQSKEMEEWKAWMDMRAADLVEPGTPLGQNLQVKAGSIMPVRNGVCGYSVLKAADHQAAAKLVADSPHLKVKDAWVDVVAFVDMEM